jgi:hypothetical protein
MKMAAALENTDGAVATKTCTRCKIEKHTSQFYMNGKRIHPHCKECHKARLKHWLSTNEQARDAVRKRWKSLEYKEKSKEYRKKHGKRLREREALYRKEHREQLNKRNRERRKTDFIFRLKNIVRNRIRRALERKSYSKTTKTETILGCSIVELQQYIGPAPGNGFELDHICPLAQARDEVELLKLCHYSNLQWLPECLNALKAHRWTLQGEVKCIELLGRNWID